MHKEIINYWRARYPALCLVTSEDDRARTEAKLAVTARREKNLKRTFGLASWNAAQGLSWALQPPDESDWGQDSTFALEMLTAIYTHELQGARATGETPSVLYLLQDLHLDLKDAESDTIQMLKLAITAAQANKSLIVMAGCRTEIPPEVERLVTVLDMKMPDREQVDEMVTDFVNQQAWDDTHIMHQQSPEDRRAVVDAAMGLTAPQVLDVLSFSTIKEGYLEPTAIARQKALEVRKTGILEIVDSEVSLDDIGGLEVIKGWMMERRRAFSPAAVEFGLPTPRGALILGLPGTGKSMTAKATAAAFRQPLLKLDAGRLYSSALGATEAAIRTVIETAEAMAPCVLWIDELEKALSGSGSSDQCDGGTTSRVLGSLLGWLQEKTAPVFVVATANDISRLPPELLRRGRFDEIFYVDMPDEEERRDIWDIHLKRRWRGEQKFDTRAMAASSVSAGFTGSEIEQAVIAAMYAAFDARRDLCQGDLLAACRETRPLSKLMPEKLESLRKSMKGRARPASLNQSCAVDDTQPMNRRVT